MKKFVWALMAAAAIFAISCNKDDSNKGKSDKDADPDVEKEELVTGNSSWGICGNLYGDGWSKDLSGVDKDGWSVLSYLEVEATSEFKVKKDKQWNSETETGHSFGLSAEDEAGIELGKYYSLVTRIDKDTDSKNIKVKVEAKTYIDFYMKADGDNVKVIAVAHGTALPAEAE